MKLQLKKAAAAAMALSMCIPSAAFGAQSSTIETSFDIYSPVLQINVPLTANIRVNPIADSNDTGTKQFTVASESLDIMNATLDDGKGIPLNVTVQAFMTANPDVITEYNTIAAPDSASKIKKIHLDLSEGKSAEAQLKDGETAGLDAEGKFDFKKYELKTKAVYDDDSKKAPITLYGSMLSIDIAAPADAANLEDVVPKVGSFAVTGQANANADWQAGDVAVSLVYTAKASAPLNIAIPDVATAPTVTGSATAVTIEVTGAGEATFLAMAVHNAEGKYVDATFENVDVEYDTTNNKITITIPANDPIVEYFASAANGFQGEAQDLVIALSDGNMVVTTLTVN